MIKISWNREKKGTTIITETPVCKLQWRRLIITRLDSDGRPYTDEKVVPYTKEEYLIHHNYDKSPLLSISEIEGRKPTQKCATCGKPFVIGEKVLRLHDLAEHTLVYIDGHLGYFGESYPSDDSLDTHEQLRYLAHSSDVNLGIIAEFKRGQELWVQGMDICHKIQHSIFKW
jgi:hypothetical protein